MAHHRLACRLAAPAVRGTKSERAAVIARRRRPQRVAQKDAGEPAHLGVLHIEALDVSRDHSLGAHRRGSSHRVPRVHLRRHPGQPRACVKVAQPLERDDLSHTPTAQAKAEQRHAVGAPVLDGDKRAGLLHLAPDEIALLLTEVVEHDEAKRLESPGHSIDKAERRLQLAGQPALARRCALWKAKQKRNVVGDVLVSTAPQEVVPAACAPQARALATPATARRNLWSSQLGGKAPLRVCALSKRL
mmetsp:Transcript_33264/g.109626  ORF Transcript_33264/g.109626 Transcript_33264/m.109626 type:complete len:246 (+) Transcript_33264:273-1010(+)